MNEKIIEIFEINTDAISTNRGFYYQYLLVLQKWIKNFIEEKDVATLTEVEDDIKEVGDEIIFTQVKCYTSSFSLNSNEIKKSIFNFFILYLKYRSLNEKLYFCFSTNSQISKKEKLLFEWTQNIGLNDERVLDLCVKKVKTILEKQIKEKRNKLLQKRPSDTEKESLKKKIDEFKNTLQENTLKPFVKNILWEFNGLSPEKSIESLIKKIHTLLGHKKFQGRSSSLLFKVLISEIYKSSQKQKISDRQLNNTILNALIAQTDKELSKSVDVRLTKLFNIEIDSIKADIANLIKVSDLHSKNITSLKNDLKKTSKKVPKHLNLLPDFHSMDIYGWDNFLIQVHSVLTKKKIFSVFSEGGMGKTSFAKKFLRTFDNYDHILWLNVENSISLSILLDSVLKENLELENIRPIDYKESYQLLIGQLNKIDGENIVIIDFQNSEEEIKEIKSLKLASNWQKLILTRSHLKNIPTTKLPNINFENAKKIYLNFCNKEPIEDCLFNEFFELIDYNILVIELAAKTIQNSFDLTLSYVVKAIKKQELDKTDLQVDIDINDTPYSIKLFNYLIEKFSLPNINEKEMNYLKFLSILPSNDIIIEDIILINGLSHYNQNKTYIINIINSLDKKGLITISNDRKRINIHKIVREVIIYVQREQLNPFISSIFFITWLTARIREGYNSPKISFRYLKYAKSILDSIKEDYRQSLYQPLILLENEFLYAQRFYLGAKSNLDKLVNLSKRAENYPGINSNNLGVIYNNLALCYAENKKHTLAKSYFKKALSKYDKSNKDILNLTIITLNNLSNIYLLEKDLINAIKSFKKVQKIRKEHNLYDDQQLCIEYKILAQSYAIAGSYKQAIKLLESGIELHKSLSLNYRNDFYLATYYNELSNLYLISGNTDKAIESQEFGIQILENMGLNNSNYLLSMYEISEKLYKYLGKNKKQNEMNEKIKQFYADNF